MKKLLLGNEISILISKHRVQQALLSSIQCANGIKGYSSLLLFVPLSQESFLVIILTLVLTVAFRMPCELKFIQTIFVINNRGKIV